jgi:hypothetical protein
VVCGKNALGQLGVANGSRGLVTGLDPTARTLTVRLDGPAGREVVLPRWYLDGRQPTERNRRVDLAYATTGHRVRILRLRRAVLATVAKRGASTEVVTLMNRLARLSARERKQLVDGFLDEVFGGIDATPDLEDHFRQAIPDLPDDPSPEQVDAWVELAELVQNPAFRRRVRALAQYSATYLQGSPDRASATSRSAPMPEPACRRNPAPGLDHAVAWRRVPTWSSNKCGRIATLPGPCPRTVPVVLLPR